MAHKTTILLALVALCAASLPADDGGSYYPEDWTFGNIYVDEPNDKIALKNELMLCRLPNVTAIFDFQNTTAETVTVPCAFPVVVEVPFCIKDGEVTARINQNALANYALLELLLGKKMKSDEYGNFCVFPVSPEELNGYDKKLRVISYEDYQKQTGSDNRCVKCDITLNGKSVPITTVGIETTISYDPENDSTYYGTPGHITAVLHFAHELAFAPRASAVLTVNYNCDAGRDSYHATQRGGFVYDISTGGTWKGCMDSFIVVTEGYMGMKVLGAPDGFTCEEMKAEANFNYDTRTDPCCSFYYRESYKPQKGERFQFSYERDWELSDMQLVWLKEKDDFVTGVKASSFLKGTYSHRDSTKHDDYEMKKSGYSPETSFDGELLNGWVEGVPGDGIGEYIEFTLKQPSLGPFATNGLTHYRYSYIRWDRTPDLPFASWQKNGRVKQLNLKKADDTLYSRIDLLDKYSGTYAEVDLECANAVLNPVIMDKGTWRLEIADVYKGTQFDDTVLGEVWFYPLSDKLYEIISQNDRSENPIYRRGIEQFLKSTETPAEFEKVQQNRFEYIQKEWQQE